jgi:hypothetical protein
MKKGDARKEKWIYTSQVKNWFPYVGKSRTVLTNSHFGSFSVNLIKWGSNIEGLMGRGKTHNEHGVGREAERY